MLAPLSWLSAFVEIKLPVPSLSWKLTEVGLNVEQIIKEGGEQVFDIEVTPNRPDWLSIIGIAREIAAVQNVKVKVPKFKAIPPKSADLPIEVKTDPKLSPRYAGITIANVKVGESASWLKKRLELVGLRPINNLVDITNYVMFELGVPIHVFDYDKFQTQRLAMTQAKGGEKFESVDELSYELPKGAIIIKDKDRVIDLCGVKGGANTGIQQDTKNIFIHVPIYNPILIRQTTKALGLTSEAAYIYERGANAGGVIETLSRVVELTLDLVGGKVASEVLDQKEKEFLPQTINLSHSHLEKVLGINLTEEKIKSLLERLGLETKINKGKESSYQVTIPTYRGDLKIEEDLMEEVARVFGYNNFPRTIPQGVVATDPVSYQKDFSLQEKARQILYASGFSEIKTFSLISEEELNLLRKEDAILSVANPVSKEYVFLRPSLLSGTFSALKLNLPITKAVSVFELEKVYKGPLSNASENYNLAAGSTKLNFREMKGVLEFLAKQLGVELSFENIKGNPPWHPSKTSEVIAKKKNKTLGFLGKLHPKTLATLGIESSVLIFEINFDLLESVSNPQKIYKPIPKYPAQIEDLSFVLPARINIGDVMNTVRQADKQIYSIELIDIYENTYTFRIEYLNPTKTLTDEDVRKIREKVLAKVKKEYRARLKS